MFRIARSRPWPPDIDLSNARETIAYIEDDMRRVPGLEKVAAALHSAIDEIDAAERSVPRATPYSITSARFMPRR